MRPEALKIVERTLIPAEEMHDYIAEVEQLPAGFRGPLNTRPDHVDLPQGVFDGLKLALGHRGTDHEVVGDARHLGDVEQDDAFGLFLGQLVHEPARQRKPLQIEIRNARAGPVGECADGRRLFAQAVLPGNAREYIIGSARRRASGREAV